MKSELRDFILSHPDTWEEELTAEPYCLKIERAEETDYIMFKYNQLCSDFNLPIVREARGIIFNEKTWQCVCRAFDKFGNYGESYVPEIDWDSAFISEKIDGSLIKLWYRPEFGQWYCSTNGKICSWEATLGATTFGDLFKKEFIKDTSRFKVLDTNKCYMFELVSPYSTVVIHYPATEIYFLGSRDMLTGQEYSFLDEPEVAAKFKTPRVYPMTSLEEVTAAAEMLDWDEEGYVVCDKNFNRCKIKSPSYVRAHYMRNNGVITVKRLLEVIEAGEEAEFTLYAEEFIEPLEKVKAAKEFIKNETIIFKVGLATLPHPLTKREHYDYVCGFGFTNKDLTNYCIKLYDNPALTWEEYTKNWDIHHWARCIEKEVTL